jgi:hypothetical protein
MDSLRSSLGREHRDQRQGASGKSGAAQEATHVDLPEGDL